MIEKKLITSESVTEGHPDKVCDQISDAILDELIKQDSYSRVAVETVCKKELLVLAGEVTTNASVDYEKIARGVLQEIGYTHPDMGIGSSDVEIKIVINKQSSDIAQGVNDGEDKLQGAGDQGMMYGYACIDTSELMPLPIILAHRLTKKLAEVRKNNIVNNLRPDGKSQVSVEYFRGRPLRVEAVVIAQQHDEEISEEELKKQILEKVIFPVCGGFMDDKTKIHINATGKFVIGGPDGDTGLTGRKIIVDTYGGVGRHGGGAFSGKDPSKVDRSGAYMARYVAKNIVAAGLADQCEVALSYAIGVAEPTSVSVNCFGTEYISEEKISELVREHFDMTPAGIIKTLDLRNPIYRQTAAYGHFGRSEAGFNWEKIDKADVLRKAIE